MKGYPLKDYLQTFTTKESFQQLMRMALIGILNTFSYFLFFNIARIADVSLFWSVTIAYILATFISYVLNRRWTFNLEGSGRRLSETASFYLVNLVAWGITIAIVTRADAWFDLDIIGENIASGFAALVILLPRFASYRDLVFKRAIRNDDAKLASRPGQ